MSVVPLDMVHRYLLARPLEETDPALKVKPNEIELRPVRPDDLVRPQAKLWLPDSRYVGGKPHWGTVPVDQEAMVQYMSMAYCFVQPQDANVHSLAPPIHYGLGAFEGIRLFRTAYGTAFPTLVRNIVRLIYSSIGISPEYAATTLGLAQETSIQIPLRSDEQIFRDATESLDRGDPLHLRIRVFENGDWVLKSFPWNLNAIIFNSEKRNYEVKAFSAYELDALFKAIVYLNGLVDVGQMPNIPQMVMSGYLRPFFYVDAQGGLGIATYTGQTKEIKPLAFSVASLPWKLYLKEQDYDTGLDVLVPPFERIGMDFVTAMKIAGHYVNSLLNVNIGNLLGFGEILALTRDGKAVEGSAENLFVIKQIGNEYVAYTPPLSDGPLMGTNRRLMIETLQEMGIRVVFKSCTLDEIKEGDTKAVFFTGTGAQTIHLRSINEMHGISHFPDAIRVKDMNGKGTEWITIPKLVKTPIAINNGTKHEVMARIQERYKARWVEQGSTILEPAYMLRDPKALASAMGLDVSDVIKNKGDRRGIEAGILRDKFDVLKDKKGAQEVLKRHQLVARLIANAVNAQRKRGPDFRLPIRRVRQTA